MGDRLPAQPALDDRAAAPAPRRELLRPDPGDLVHVLALPVRGRRDRAALRLLPRARALHPLPEHADRREPDRPRWLCDAADGAAADVPAGRLQRHARPARCPDARLEPDPVLGEPLCGDAEPPLGRRSDRRRDDGARRALDVGEGALARVAGVGLVQRDGDRQPLLARHRRRDRGRRRGGGGRLPAVAAASAPHEPQGRIHGRRARDRLPLDDGARAHARDAEHADRRGGHALRGRGRARLLRVPQTSCSSSGRAPRRSSPARFSTSSTARSPEPAASRRRSAASSIRRSTGWGRG